MTKQLACRYFKISTAAIAGYTGCCIDKSDLRR